MIKYTFCPELITFNRQTLGLSTSDLAKRIGRYRQQVEQWEKGIRTPNANMIALIVSALEISPGKLFDEGI